MQHYNKMIQKMINFDDVTKEGTKEHNLNFPKMGDLYKNMAEYN